jgi:dTDP-glucose 4,6-dehydratase
MIAIAYWKTYGVPVVITNSNNIVGFNQNKEKFIPKVIDLIKRGEVVKIHTVNGKPGKRHYNPVQNIAAALQAILEMKPVDYPDSDRPDRYSLPGGEELDNLEMAQLIASIMGRELKHELVDAETVRPGYDQFYPRTDGGRLIDLGFKPPVTLSYELAKIVEALNA